MRPVKTLLVCALLFGLGACTTQTDPPKSPTLGAPPPPAPAELIRRLEDEKRQKEQQAAASAAAASGMRTEVERAASSFLAALVKDDLAQAQAQILDDEGVNDTFKPAMASILLAGRTAKIEQEWQGFQTRRAGAVIELVRVEVGAIDKVDNKSSPAFAKSLDHCESAKIFYKQGAVERAVELKTGLKTAKGWRFLQVNFGN